MQIEYGDVSADISKDRVAAIIDRAFKDIIVGPYGHLYVAIPHAASDWKKYEPTTPQSGRLEIYLYSAPTKFTTSGVGVVEKLMLKGKTFNLLIGQKDRIIPVEYDTTYSEMLDDIGNCVALRKDNRVWIAFDFLHSDKNADTLVAIFDEIIKFVEGRVAYGVDEIGILKTAMLDVNKIELNNLTRELDSRRRNVESYQRSYIQSIADYVKYKKRVDDFDVGDETKITKAAQSILDMDMIARVRQVNGQVVVYTKPIMKGPLNWGEWQITLSTSISVERAIRPTRDVGVRHPHEYGSANNCLGDFTGEIATAMQTGEWDKAINLYLLWVTNSQVSSRISPLEDYLIAVMGKDEYHQAIKTLIPDVDIDYRVGIVHVLGNEIRLTYTDQNKVHRQKTVNVT